MLLLDFHEGAEKKLVEERFQDLLHHCDSLSETEQADITRAFVLAATAHKDMRRKSGEPYIVHPIAVAKIVRTEIELSSTSIICALLHDVVEDTEITLEEIRHDFGDTIAHIIDGLTKISSVFKKKDETDKQQATQNKAQKPNWIESKAMNFRKVLLAMGEDIRVILIKLADRLHNMRTMDAMPPPNQVKISSETLFLYVPIAHRLGLYRIKSELEDWCTKYMQRKTYKEIAKKLAETKRSRTRYIQEFIAPVEAKLKTGGIPKFRIFGRPKHIYSILNKIRKKKVPFEEIYDLFAIRIIIDVPEKQEKAECWKAYSIITDLYSPNTSRLRDWLSHPKSNGYESLHITVMGPKGRWVEVQIRSERMDAIAEKGIAAHWKYKGQKGDGKFDDWLAKIRESLKNREASAVDFINDFKHNFYESEIFVFTPKGDLRRLPAKASVLDFAFDIHTDVGCMCIGAKIDGKLYPIKHRLKSGDQVEILTSKKQKPNKDWLDFAITGKARTKIKSYLKNEKRASARMGKEILERKLKSWKLKISTPLLEEFFSYFKYPDMVEFLHSINIGEFNLSKIKDIKDYIQGDKIVLPKTRKPVSITEETSEYEKIQQKKQETDNFTSNNGNALYIFGGFADKIDYKIPNCCKPVAGDAVFGFLTIHKGITIHRSDCPNSTSLMERYPYRIVDIKWARQTKDVLFQAQLQVSGTDDVGVINNITSVISGKLKINIRSISVNAKDGIFEGKLVVFVKDTKELKNLIKELKKVDGIRIVKRLDG